MTFIKIGLVGLGFIGKQHLQAYRQIENCRVKAICSGSEHKGNILAEEFQTTFIGSYDALLADPDIDMIDICVPTHLHESFIIKAANAGKHIICEKPLTLSMDSAKRIMGSVDTHGVRLFVGHVVRFWPEYALIKSYSESSLLKGIETVHAERLSQAPKWSDWFRHPEKSGGVLFDLHIHDVDFICALLGEVNSVYAVGHQNEYGAWDHVMTMLTFKGGANAFIEASHRMPQSTPFTMSLRAQSDKAAVDFRIASGDNIEDMEGSHKQMNYITDAKVTSLQVNEEDAFEKELSYFVECVDHNKENKIIPLADVSYTLTILEAIKKSLEKGGCQVPDNVE